MSRDEEYVCTLNDASLEKATKELNEEPKERLSAVQTFREWIQQQPHICCPTDTAYLLRYLRVAKFSQLKAREKLTGYLTCKTEFPKWYNDIDMTEPGIQAILDTGYLVPLPGTDPDGRKIILSIDGAVDTNSKLYDCHTAMRTTLGLTHHFIADENNQVNGFIVMSDMTHFSLKHQTFYGMEVMKNSTRCFEGHFPARFKGTYVYNEGPILDALMTVMKPFMSKKTLSRMFMFGNNMEEVYKRVPKHLLPDEYLPDDYDGPSAGSVKSIVENLKQELASQKARQQLLASTKAEYGIDKKRAPADTQQASFRKLNVD